MLNTRDVDSHSDTEDTDPDAPRFVSRPSIIRIKDYYKSITNYIASKNVAQSYTLRLEKYETPPLGGSGHFFLVWTGKIARIHTYLTAFPRLKQSSSVNGCLATVLWSGRKGENISAALPKEHKFGFIIRPNDVNAMFAWMHDKQSNEYAVNARTVLKNGYIPPKNAVSKLGRVLRSKYKNKRLHIGPLGLQTNLAQWQKMPQFNGFKEGKYYPVGSVTLFAINVWRKALKAHPDSLTSTKRCTNEVVVYQRLVRNPIDGLLINVTQCEQHVQHDRSGKQPSLFLTKQSIKEMRALLETFPHLKLYIYDQKQTAYPLRVVDNERALALLLNESPHFSPHFCCAPMQLPPFKGYIQLGGGEDENYRGSVLFTEEKACQYEEQVWLGTFDSLYDARDTYLTMTNTVLLKKWASSLLYMALYTDTRRARSVITLYKKNKMFKRLVETDLQLFFEFRTVHANLSRSPQKLLNLMSNKTFLKNIQHDDVTYWRVLHGYAEMKNAPEMIMGLYFENRPFKGIGCGFRDKVHASGFLRTKYTGHCLQYARYHDIIDTYVASKNKKVCTRSWEDKDLNARQYDYNDVLILIEAAYRLVEEMKTRFKIPMNTRFDKYTTPKDGMYLGVSPCDISTEYGAMMHIVLEAMMYYRAAYPSRAGDCVLTCDNQEICDMEALEKQVFRRLPLHIKQGSYTVVSSVMDSTYVRNTQDDEEEKGKDNNDQSSLCVLPSFPC